MTSAARFDLAARVEQIEAEAWAQLNGLAPPEFRARVGLEVHRVGSTICVVSARSKILSVNRVLGLGCPDVAGEAQIDDILALYRVAGVEKCLIQLSPVAIPPRIDEWLRARGAYRIAPTIKLVCSLASVEPAWHARFDVRDVTQEEVSTFERIVAPRLGVPEGLEAGISSMIGRPDWRYYFVLDDRSPIAAAGSFIRGDHAWLGLAATCEEHRGLGAQSFVIAKRLEDAARAGCRWASADTSVPTAERPNQSLKNMLRLGFEVLYERVNYVVPLGDTP